MQLTETLNVYMKTQKWQFDQSSSQKKRKGDSTIYYTTIIKHELCHTYT